MTSSPEQDTCLVSAGQGEFAEAAAAYEAAGDLDSVVRLSLEKLNSPHKASAMVRKAGSREAAQRLARHCVAARDYQVDTLSEPEAPDWILTGSCMLSHLTQSQHKNA